jgi:hypothetical protein
MGPDAQTSAQGIWRSLHKSPPHPRWSWTLGRFTWARTWENRITSGRPRLWERGKRVGGRTSVLHEGEWNQITIELNHNRIESQLNQITIKSHQTVHDYKGDKSVGMESHQTVYGRRWVGLARAKTEEWEGSEALHGESEGLYEFMVWNKNVSSTFHLFTSVNFIRT